MLSGEAGNDRLFGGVGFDTLDGGSETDYCDVGPSELWHGETTVNCETEPSSK